MDAPSGDADPQLPDRLKARRKELRLGPVEAARRAGVGRMAWYEWENGRRAPRDSNYAGIDAAMEWESGRGVDAILAGKEPVEIPQDEPARDLRSDPDYQEYLARYRALLAKGFSRDDAIDALTDEEQPGVQDAHRTDQRRDAG